MTPRLLLLPLAAVVIAGLCAWKATRTYEDPRFGEGPVQVRSAASPELAFVERNEELWPVKLSAYLGRHRILLAFFDGRTGADKSRLLLRLRDDYAELQRRGYVVLAIGDADPIANRAAIKRAGGFPFEILADVDAADADGGRHTVDYDTLVKWGRFDPDMGRVLPGVVEIDRAGYVRWENGRPVAKENPYAPLDELLDD